MKYYSTQYWNRGKRSRNEDSLSVEQVRTRRGSLFFACVCDGIGGLEAGETASGYTAEALAVWLHQRGIRCLKRGGMDYLSVCMKRELTAISRRIFDYGREEGIRLGTTASVLVLWKHSYFILQAGDGRIYRIRHLAKQLTRDDTDQRGVLLKGIGAAAVCTPGLLCGRVKNGDRFLLCSDGFYRNQTREELGRTLGRHIALSGDRSGRTTEERDWTRVLEELGRRIYARGETDNSSAVFVCCVKGGGPDAG